MLPLQESTAINLPSRHWGALASVLLLKGVSAGAVLVFLITGPATNVTTFGILKRTHSLLSSIVFAATVFIAAIAFGVTVNILFPGSSASTPSFADHEHGALEWTAASILGLLFVISILRKGPRGFLQPLGETFSTGAKLPHISHEPPTPSA